MRRERQRSYRHRDIRGTVVEFPCRSAAIAQSPNVVRPHQIGIDLLVWFSSCVRRADPRCGPVLRSD